MRASMVDTKRVLINIIIIFSIFQLPGLRLRLASCPRGCVHENTATDLNSAFPTWMSQGGGVCTLSAEDGACIARWKVKILAPGNTHT